MLLSTYDVNQENIKEWAILDSGASSHFLCLDAPVTNKQPATNPITIVQPDGDVMVSTHTGDLDLPQLPQAARRCHILPAIKYSLISVVKLCEAGCEVKFIKWGVGIETRYRGRLAMEGSLNKRTGLWMVPLTHQKPVTNHLQPQMHIKQVGANSGTQNYIEQQKLAPDTSLRSSSNQTIAYERFAGNIRQTTSKAELAMYHHQTMGSPPRPTFLRAIRKHPKCVATFPGLTYELIRKHLPLSTATLKGHMIH